MPFWRSFAHLVWTTKNREPLINPGNEDALHGCLIAKADELDCYIHAIGNVADHIHIIISIPPKHSVATVVKHLKGNSSHFMNHELGDGSPDFAWQRGYGYLTLGESQCERAIAYVRGQKQHHRTNSTNSWLERVDEDEGGHTAGMASSNATFIREDEPVYIINDELFF